MNEPQAAQVLSTFSIAFSTRESSSTRGSASPSSGIDLITVEARIVVASIDTYLKYSEAVGQVAPASKPAIEGKGYEELIAENSALRAQINAVPARRAAGRRRAPARS